MNRILPAGLVILLATIMILRSTPAQSISVIYDAEIEKLIRSLSTPVLTAAGLNTNFVQVYIVNDRKMNAFVTNGQRIFINSGLILDADHANQLVSVIAHETGHLVAGHLARAREELRSAATMGILTAVFGAVVAGVGNKSIGNKDVAAAIMGSAQAIRDHKILAYSRTQEFAADQLAVRLLDSSGMSSRGLLEMLEKLVKKDGKRTDYVAYLSTHPLSSKRISVLRTRVEASPHHNAQHTDDQNVLFRRAKAKLLGFLEPQSALRRYPPSDLSIEARYSRAASYHLLARTNEALAEVELLIASAPNYAFFHELKGQILFESGQNKSAIEPYQEAVRLEPHEPLIKISLAQALISLNNPALISSAINHLEYAVSKRPDLATAWRYLAVAYGRAGLKGKSSLASAEFAIQIGRTDTALSHARRATEALAIGSPGHLRALDILTTIKDPPK